MESSNTGGVFGLGAFRPQFHTLWKLTTELRLHRDITAFAAAAIIGRGTASTDSDKLHRNSSVLATRSWDWEERPRLDPFCVPKRLNLDPFSQ